MCRSSSSYQTYTPDSPLHRVTYTSCCIDTIDSPDDEHKDAPNLQRIEINIVYIKEILRQVGYLLRGLEL